MSAKPTTTRGKCRKCGNRWSVKKTPLNATTIVRPAPPIPSYVRGLPASCPACHSVLISYVLDDPSSSPRGPVAV